MLSGQRVRFLIKRSAFTIGRPTSTHGAVSASYHPKLVFFASQRDDVCRSTIHGSQASLPISLSGWKLLVSTISLGS